MSIVERADRLATAERHLLSAQGALDSGVPPPPSLIADRHGAQTESPFYPHADQWYCCPSELCATGRLLLDRCAEGARDKIFAHGDAELRYFSGNNGEGTRFTLYPDGTYQWYPHTRSPQLKRLLLAGIITGITSAKRWAKARLAGEDALSRSRPLQQQALTGPQVLDWPGHRLRL